LERIDQLGAEPDVLHPEARRVAAGKLGRQRRDVLAVLAQGGTTTSSTASR